MQPPDPIDTDGQGQPPSFPLQQQQEQPSASNNLGLMTHPPTMQIDFSPLHQIIKLNLIEDKQDPPTLSPSDELLHCHHKLGHAPFKTLQSMAIHGELPRKLAMVIPPFCATCKYGKQTKCPWHTKGQQTHLHTVTQPGQVVSVDQLESMMPGFVAQLKGLLTTQRY